MSALTWETPAPSNAGRPPRQDWAAIAAELKARPGEWAVIDTKVSASASSAFRMGANRAFRPTSDWEFVSRGWDKGARRYEKLYGRFVGVAS